MKIAIFISIILSFSAFAQPDCDNIETLLKNVDETYAELSQRPFPNYVKCTLPNDDTLKISLNNAKGERVYKENFGLLTEDTYIIKFFNPQCPGIYFVSIKIGNNQVFMKSIQINSEEFPSGNITTNIDSTYSILNGNWRRSYSEDFIPMIQPESNTEKIIYHYQHNVQLQFSGNNYKIFFERINIDNYQKTTKYFEGKFVVLNDTLKLCGDSGLTKVFHYKVETDSLLISYFTSTVDNNDRIAIPVEKNIDNSEIKLVGIYSR